MKTHLHMHAKEADIHAILFLEGKHGSGSVGEVVHHLARVHVSRNGLIKKQFYFALSQFSPGLHPRLDLDLFIPREHDSDVDIPGLSLLLPQEVVDPGLDVGAESCGL